MLAHAVTDLLSQLGAFDFLGGSQNKVAAAVDKEIIMFVVLRKLVVILIYFAIIILQPASAQTGQATDNIYWPSYVTYYVPLSLFLPQSLHPACSQLIEGDLPQAEDAFKTEIRLHPDDLAAYLGYLQAARAHRDGLLEGYEQAAKKNASPANAFKLGILAYYKLGEEWHNYSPEQAIEKQKLVHRHGRIEEYVPSYRTTRNAVE